MQGSSGLATQSRSWATLFRGGPFDYPWASCISTVEELRETLPASNSSNGVLFFRFDPSTQERDVIPDPIDRLKTAARRHET